MFDTPARLLWHQPQAIDRHGRGMSRQKTMTLPEQKPTRWCLKSS